MTQKIKLSEIRELVRKALNESKIKENKNPCWDGYKQLGTKTKNGKEVPNCIKESVKTKKIKLSEVRKIVRNILKEEFEDKNPNLSDKEKNILKDILKEINNLQEADFNNIIKKVKEYASKGLLTTGIVLALLATPNITNAQSDEIKKIANIENIQQKQQTMNLDQLINLIDKNPKIVYDKIYQNDEEFINTINNIFKHKDTNEINKEAIKIFEDWIRKYFIDKGLVFIKAGSSDASDDIKNGVSVKDVDHFNDIINRNKGITKILLYQAETEEDKLKVSISKELRKIYYKI